MFWRQTLEEYPQFIYIEKQYDKMSSLDVCLLTKTECATTRDGTRI